MLGSQNSVLTRLKAKQPSVISFHCNCHIAALIANHACNVLPDQLEDLTVHNWYYFQEGETHSKNFKRLLIASPTNYSKLLRQGGLA